MEQWYSVSREDLIYLGGDTVLRKYYGDCLFTMLRNVYPLFDWQPWKFVHVRINVDWKDPYHWERYLEWFCNCMRINHPEDWQNIRLEDIYSHNGWGFLNLFESDTWISKILQQLYPEYNWPHWKFQQVPKSFWNDTHNCRRYFMWLASR